MIKNYLNYIGSKDRYLSLIMKFIEKGSQLHKGARLIDLFCGSAVVGINSLNYFNLVACNDACEELIKIHKWVQNTPKEFMFSQIDACIQTYGLSKTNKEGFLKLREDYNTLEAVDPIRLFCLIMHSYNYSLHLNKKGGYNVPFGANRSSFNSSLATKLDIFKDEMDKNPRKLVFLSQDFEDVMLMSTPQETVLFVDPPYSASISKHPYRVGSLKWTEDEDRRLFKALDTWVKQGGSFIFTNVLENNGISNRPLIEWSQKYIVTPVDVEYKNCSYQRKNNGETKEVIISNFGL